MSRTPGLVQADSVDISDLHRKTIDDWILALSEAKKAFSTREKITVELRHGWEGESEVWVVSYRKETPSEKSRREEADRKRAEGFEKVERERYERLREKFEGVGK